MGSLARLCGLTFSSLFFSFQTLWAVEPGIVHKWATLISLQEPDYARIIDDAVKNPWGSRSYPDLPGPTYALRENAIQEMAHNAEVTKAMISLDPKKGNLIWFQGMETLQAKKAVACLQIALCHPHDDVQVKSLRALRILGDAHAVPFLLIYAQYMDKDVMGSENATLHGIIQEEIANTLSTLTGTEMKIKGQDPKELARGIALWTRWLVDHPQ